MLVHYHVTCRANRRVLEGRGGCSPQTISGERAHVTSKQVGENWFAYMPSHTRERPHGPTNRSARGIDTHIGESDFRNGSFLFFFPGICISHCWLWTAPELETQRKMLSNNTKTAVPRWAIPELQAFEQSGNYCIFSVSHMTFCPLTKYLGPLEVHIWLVYHFTNANDRLAVVG